MDVERGSKVLGNINEEVLGERVQVDYSTQALDHDACGMRYQPKKSIAVAVRYCIHSKMTAGENCPEIVGWLVEPRTQLSSGQFDVIGVNIVVGLICATSP
jgi:hypothetical protein